MPTVRAVRSNSPRVPSSKPSPSKLGRSRAGSLPVNGVNEQPERVVVGASEWLPGGEKFEVVEEQLELEGFQIYAVEKWYASLGNQDCSGVVMSLRLYQGLSRVKGPYSC